MCVSAMYARAICMGVHICACMCMRVYACTYACVFACVCVCACVSSFLRKCGPAIQLLSRPRPYTARFHAHTQITVLCV